MSTAQTSPTAREFLLGAAFAMTTVTIWSGWNVMSRMGLGAALTPFDITFLRYAVSGGLALPLFIKYLPIYRAIPKHYLLMMAAGSGFPYLWLASMGFQHAPASHGALIPGFMLLCVAMLSYAWLKEPINGLRRVGYAIIAATILYQLVRHYEGLSYLLADAWFMTAGIFWAMYTVVNKRTGIMPLQALALVSSGSAMVYCPLYLLFSHERLAELPLMPSLMQMGYQGVIVGFVAFFCYNKAIGLIGASRASAFAAAIPILTILLALPILGEVAAPADWWFAGLLTVGVLLSTGALRRILGVKQLSS